MLAVLPFENYSAETAQEYLADGLTEEMIAQLGSLNSERLGVIARTSAMKYRRARVGVDQIGKELGVEYVLEGSIRSEGDRVRVTAQLVEAAAGGHLWAERFDRDLADIFAVQDEITARVSEAIQPATATTTNIIISDATGQVTGTSRSARAIRPPRSRRLPF